MSVLLGNTKFKIKERHVQTTKSGTSEKGQATPIEEIAQNMQDVLITVMREASLVGRKEDSTMSKQEVILRLGIMVALEVSRGASLSHRMNPNYVEMMEPMWDSLKPEGYGTLAETTKAYIDHLNKTSVRRALRSLDSGTLQ